MDIKLFEHVIRTELCDTFFDKYKKEIKEFNLTREQIIQKCEKEDLISLDRCQSLFNDLEKDRFVLYFCVSLKYSYKPSDLYLGKLISTLEKFVNDEIICQTLLTLDPASNLPCSPHCSFCLSLCYDCEKFGHFTELNRILPGRIYDRTLRFTCLIPYLFKNRKTDLYLRAIEVSKHLLTQYPKESLTLFINLYNFSKYNDKELFQYLQEIFMKYKKEGILEKSYREVLGLSWHDVKDKNPFEDKDRRLITLFDLD